MATNTKAIKFSNNGYTYLPVTNSDIVQYSNQGISVTTAIQTLAASSQNTFIDGDESSAILHIKSVDGSTVNRSYTFEGAGSVTVSYSNNTVTISGKDESTTLAGHYTPTGTATNATYVNGNLTLSTGSVPLTHGSSLVITGVKYSKDSKGHITDISYSLGKLPSDSDTKNTAGSNNDANKLFLVGAKSQTTNNNGVQTFSNSAVYTWGGATYSTTFKGDLLGTINTETTATTQSTSDDSTKVATTAFVHDVVDGALTNLSGALKYKGVVTKNSDLPTASASTVGDVYVVKTAGNYNIDHNADGTASSQALEAGDYIIGTYIGTTYTWIPVNGENQVTPGTKTLPAGGTEITLVTVDGIAVPILHGTPTGEVKNATKGTDGSQLTHNSSMVMTGVNWKADANGHVTEVSYTLAKLPPETQLSKAGTDKTVTLTHGGTFTYISNLNVSNHKITYDYTTATLPSQGPDYGKIKVVKHSAAVTDAIAESTADATLTSVADNELVTFESVNKWLHIKGTNSTTAGSDKVQFSHALSAAGAKSEGLYKIATDAAGHVISATAASFGAAPTGLKYVTSTTDVEDFTLSGITFETTTVDLAKVFTPTVNS